jgi:hypothetical protein
MKTVNVNINTGELVKVSNDPSRTHTVAWKEQPLKAWQKKELEMTSRARNFYPNVRESALERELWNQVSQNQRPDFPTSVNPRLAADYAAFQSKLKREDLISRQLFDQIADLGMQQ